MSKPKVISIDGEDYIRLSDADNQAEKLDGLEYVLVRGDRSGVFTGYLELEEGRTVVLRDCRRIWYWSGAASISQLAKDGVSNPSDCKFPEEVDKLKILDAIEIIPMTEKARISVKNVEPWKS